MKKARSPISSFIGSNSFPFVPEGDLIQQLVYAERGASIHASFVEGRPILASGRLAGIDEASILAEIKDEFKRLQPLYDEAEKTAARMVQALKRIQARCARHPIDEHTFQARLA